MSQSNEAGCKEKKRFLSKTHNEHKDSFLKHQVSSDDEESRLQQKSNLATKVNFSRRHKMDSTSIRYFLRVMRSSRLSGQDIEDAINNITLPEATNSYVSTNDKFDNLKFSSLESTTFTQISTNSMKRKYKDYSHHVVKDKTEITRDVADITSSPHQSPSLNYLRQLNAPWLSLQGRNIHLRHQKHVQGALHRDRVVQSAPPVLLDPQLVLHQAPPLMHHNPSFKLCNRSSFISTSRKPDMTPSKKSTIVVKLPIEGDLA